MSFFNHVQLHKYDLTNAGIDQACYDELVASGNNSTEDQLWILAADMRERFKDYMRPLFAQVTNYYRTLNKGSFFDIIKEWERHPPIHTPIFFQHA